jgi:Fe-S cluster assembly protein SufD
MEAVAVQKEFAPEFVELPGAPEWLGNLRRSAFSRFEELGFPAAGNEAWRYTGLQPVLGTPWTPARRAPQLRSPAPSGVRMRRLSEIPFGEIEPSLARIARPEHNAFVALNTASLDDAVVLEIAPGAVIADPIEIVWTPPPADRPEVTHPRLLILAGERSQASVVEAYAGEGRYFRNAVTEIALAEGSLLQHYKLQRESVAAYHVHALAARLGRASHFTSHNIALGSALARTDLDVILDAEGAECTLNGLFMGSGTQHIDNHTTIDHAKPHCVSRELYKGIMDDRSRGVFYGKIIVRPDAQKTDAIQTNKNLLLSRHALVNSTPALEIFADDVKCRHGATTGQLDPAALFYVRSRGIGEAQARALLTYAFASDVANRLRIPSIRQTVLEELNLRLGGSFEEGLR